MKYYEIKDNFHGYVTHILDEKFFCNAFLQTEVLL